MQLFPEGLVGPSKSSIVFPLPQNIPASAIVMGKEPALRGQSSLELSSASKLAMLCSSILER